LALLATVNDLDRTNGTHLSPYFTVPCQLDEQGNLPDPPPYYAVLSSKEEAQTAKEVNRDWQPRLALQDGERLRNATLTVAWQTSYDGQLDGNPNPGGGLRMFPDAAEPGGNPRQVVRVKATVGDLAPGEKRDGHVVYFKSFDVDDPSSNAPPIDNEGQTQDNRGTPPEGNLNPGFAVTNAQGEATVDFTVTMKPGDNFRVAADLNNDTWLNGLKVKQNDPQALIYESDEVTPIPPGKRTDLLTVWRKLHFELDSVGPVEGNYITRLVKAVYQNQPVPGHSVVTIYNYPQAHILENGRMEVLGSVYPIIDNDQGGNIEVNGLVGADAAGKPANLWEDDAQEMPAPPVFGDTLKTQFARAYIKCVNDGGGNPQNNNNDVPFDANFFQTRVEFIISQGKQSPDSQSTYWTAYIQSDFQAYESQDLDPNSELAAGTVVAGWHHPRGSLAFRETTRDYCALRGYSGHLTTLTDRLELHETAHGFGLKDNDPQGAESVMHYAAQWDPSNPGGAVFLPQQIATVRNCANPDKSGG